MAFTTVINRARLAVGTHSFGPDTVPATARALSFRFARFEKRGNGQRKSGTAWPDGSTVGVTVEVSYDDGDTWVVELAGVYPGGVEIRPVGRHGASDEREWTKGFLTLHRVGTQRQVRGAALLSESLRSTLEIEYGV